MSEEWRTVPGHNHYEVSDQGRVRSLPRWSEARSRHYGGRLLKPTVNRIGYSVVALSAKGAGKKRTVHSLVAEAFIGPRPEGHDVRHLNGNKNDNRVENLAYGTRSENNLDFARQGRERKGWGASGVKGVYKDSRGRWSVQINRAGKRHFGGNFWDFDQAAEAAASLRARLNSR